MCKVFPRDNFENLLKLLVEINICKNNKVLRSVGIRCNQRHQYWLNIGLNIQLKIINNLIVNLISIQTDKQVILSN